VLEIEIGSELVWSWAIISRSAQEQILKRDHSREYFKQEWKNKNWL